MRNLLVTITCLISSGLIIAQDHRQADSAINAQIDAMAFSWNHHNFDDLKNYTTENTDWVNVVGMWWKGRKESQYAHQAYHNTILKESVMTKDSVTIRYVTTDVAIAHIKLRFNAFTDPAGKRVGPDDSIATIVYVNQGGKWLMTAGTNVAIVKEVQQYDPIKQMPKN